MKRLYHSVLSIIIFALILINITSCQNTTVNSEVSDSRINISTSTDTASIVSDKYPNLSEFENEYTQAYIDENKNDVYKLQQDKSVTFITVQDIHIESIDSKRYDQLRDIVIITEQLDVDYVAVLGDLTSSLYEHDAAIDMLKKVKEILDQP